MQMRIRSVQASGTFELINRLRNITLLNQPDIRPYRDAKIVIEQIDASLINPTSFYVHADRLQLLEELHLALSSQLRGLFDCRGWLDYVCDSECGEPEVRSIMPPVVEMSTERVIVGQTGVDTATVQVPLIADGMHRVWLARKWNRPITVVLISGVSVPYYAYPCGWHRVQVLAEVPKEKHKRKVHRIEDHYSLFRDFGALGGKPRHPEEVT